MSAVAMQNTMRTVHAVLRGQLDPKDASKKLDVQHNRMGAYQRFVKAHIASVLKKNFVTLAAVVGDDTWERLVDGFFAAFPADDYELNASVRRFPEYVQSLAVGGVFDLSEFHAELAIFEWQEFAVYATPTELPDVASLERPTLNPTTQILDFTHPIGSFVRAFRRWETDGGERLAAPEPQREIVFVLRHPSSLRHTYMTADDVLLFAFKVAHEQLTSEEARSAGISLDDFNGALSRASELGLVLLPNNGS